MVYYCRII